MDKCPSFPTQIDSTMLSAFVSCPTKFLYEHVFHLATTGISPDLHAGGAFAHALEHIRGALYSDEKPIEEALLIGTQAFLEFWGDYEPPDDHPKSLVNTFNALVDYFDVYPPETDPVRPFMLSTGKPAVEFTFAIPTTVMHPETGDPILYCGRFDLLGYYNNVLFIIDEKTTKSLGGTWARQWDMRGQLMGYCFAAQQYGYNVSHALIRGVAIQKTQSKHLQAIAHFAQWQLTRWWDHANQHILRMTLYYKHAKEQFEKTGKASSIFESWPQSFADACSSYGGCAFMGLCASEEPDLWFSDFKIRVWDPLAKDPTAKSPKEVVTYAEGTW